MSKENRKRNGINIIRLNSLAILVMAVVFVFILVISNIVNKKFHAVETNIEKFITCEKGSQYIEESADYLTDNARLFAVTLDKEYAERYFEEIEVTKRQEQALEMIRQVCNEKDLALQRLGIAIEQAQGLINMELYTIRLGYMLIGEENLPPLIKDIAVGVLDKQLDGEQLHKKIINNLFEGGYQIYKKRINENCSLTVDSIEQQVKDELNMNAYELGLNLNRLRFQYIVLLVLNVLMFVVFAFLIFIPLTRFRKSIKNDSRLSVIGSQECRELAQSYNEIYDRKAMNEKSLLQKAEYDALTGILNRRAFDQICRNSAEQKEKIAMLLIDMDNFKSINDTYGHSGGDIALKELARILTETFRSGDFVARIGGDEFAVILPGCPEEAGNTIIEKISRINEELSGLHDIKNVSVSVGVAFSEVGYNETLFKNADEALYQVKENGRHGCRIFSS